MILREFIEKFVCHNDMVYLYDKQKKITEEDSYDADLVCPICGESIDTCDLADWSSGDIDCPHCGAELEYQIDYIFSTRVKKKPEVKVIR